MDRVWSTRPAGENGGLAFEESDAHSSAMAAARFTTSPFIRRYAGAFPGKTLKLADHTSTT
jgi:hypothetical protein